MNGINMSNSEIRADAFFEWFFMISIKESGLSDDEHNVFINQISDNCMETSDGQIHNIKMYINEVEVNPIGAIKELQNQFINQVDIAAKQLLKKKYSSIVEKLVLIEEILEK